MRRFAHYDYWSDSVRESILVESGADILSYGMGENQTIEIASRLANGEDVRSMIDIRGTCVCVPVREYVPGKSAQCPSYEQVVASKREYAVSCRIQQDEPDAVRGKRIIACDIPSGIGCDDGRVSDGALCASTTVTFAAYKPCFFLYPGKNYCGKV